MSNLFQKDTIVEYSPNRTRERKCMYVGMYACEREAREPFIQRVRKEDVDGPRPLKTNVKK